MIKLLIKIYFKLKKFYNSIPNRLLALIIFLILFFIFIFFINKNYISENSNLIIKSNTDNYNILLEKKILKISLVKRLCKEKICKINNIIPWKYKIIINKKWYKEIIKNIEISKNKNYQIKINLEKKIILEKSKVNNKIILTRKEKIKILKAKIKNEQILKIDEKNFLKEKSINKKIFIYINNNEIINFEKNDKNNIFFDKIFQNKNEIYIFSGEKIYIFNLITKNLIDFNFKIEPKYIKKFWENYVVITKKWSFIYNPIKNKLDYFYLFKDFVIYKNNLIWIIYSDEFSKKNNLWLNNIKENIIMDYNQKTLTKKILLKTSKNIEKIFVKNKKIYIIADNTSFELNWF